MQKYISRAALVCASLLLASISFAQVANPAGPSTGSPITPIIVSSATAPALGSACPTYNLEWFNYQTGEREVCLNGVVSVPAAHLFSTSTNCSSSASPAVCSAAPVGSVVIAASATSVVVNTSAVTANSQILITFDSSLGTKLGVTCNTTYAAPYVTARSAATSFTISVGTAPTTNPACYSFEVIN